MSEKTLWEVLVPATDRGGDEIPVAYHRRWDERVRRIAGRLTILSPSKGEWVSPDGELFQEPMIPVRVLCSEEQIDEIIEAVFDHYDQEAVLAYEISSNTILRSRAEASLSEDLD